MAETKSDRQILSIGINSAHSPIFRKPVDWNGGYSEIIVGWTCVVSDYEEFNFPGVTLYWGWTCIQMGLLFPCLSCQSLRLHVDAKMCTVQRFDMLDVRVNGASKDWKENNIPGSISTSGGGVLTGTNLPLSLYWNGTWVYTVARSRIRIPGKSRRKVSGR